MKKDIKDLRFKVAVSTTKYQTEEEKIKIQYETDIYDIDRFVTKVLSFNEIINKIENEYIVTDIYVDSRIQNFSLYEISTSNFVQTNMVEIPVLNYLDSLNEILPKIKMIPSFIYSESESKLLVYMFEEPIKTVEEYQEIFNLISRSILINIKDLKIGNYIVEPLHRIHTRNKIINNNIVYNKFDFDYFKNDYNIPLSILKEEVINKYIVINVYNSDDFDYEEDCSSDTYFIIDKSRLKTKRLCEIKKEGYDCESFQCIKVEFGLNFEFDFGIDFEEENIIDSFNECFNTSFNNLKEIEVENNETYNYFIDTYRLRNETHQEDYVIEYEFNNEYRALNNNIGFEEENQIIFLEDKELERDLIIEYLSMTHKLFMNNNKVEEFKYLEDYDFYLKVNNDNQNFYVARTYVYDIYDENL